MVHVDGLFTNKYGEKLEYGHVIGRPLGNNDWPDHDICTLPYGAEFQHSRKVRTLTETILCVRILERRSP